MTSILDKPLATRENALKQLEALKPKLGHVYAADRNFDNGPGKHSSVSTLSPWVRHRLILEEELVSAALGSHSFAASEKFIQEVFWRSYWKGWLEMRPQVWHDYELCRDQDLSDWEGRPELQDARTGNTGITCFDFWVRELVETNYLHNHARMWFASIWIFTLRLPWTLGADFFMQHLLDGDPASNTLSWRWVGGLQTRGKTYLARADNICKFTRGRFNPASQLAMDAQPLDGPVAPAPKTLSFQNPVSPDTPYVLIVTEDDLGIESLDISSKCLRQIINVNCSEKRSPNGISRRVAGFITNAMSTTIEFANELEIPVIQCDPDDINGIINTVNASGARQVITPFAPVGPVQGVLGVIEDRAIENNISFTRLARSYDRETWPYAIKGFFKFKEAIPSLIARLGLG